MNAAAGIGLVLGPLVRAVGIAPPALREELVPVRHVNGRHLLVLRDANVLIERHEPSDAIVVECDFAGREMEYHTAVHEVLEVAMVERRSVHDEQRMRVSE